MKKFIYIVVIVIISSCSSEKSPDCIQTVGEIIQKEYDLERFDTITAYDKIKVVLKQSPVQRVVLETGENLMNDISVSNEAGNLLLKSGNNCNMFREYNVTTVYVESPNLHTVKNFSGVSIVSDGILAYDTLNLISENSGEIGMYRVDGTFDVNVNCENLKIVINNLCTTTIKGSASNLNIDYADGDARFEGRFLKAKNVTVFHRGTNDIIISPEEKLTGKLVSTGNLILANTPPVLQVEELYKGRVIIE